MSLKFYYDLMSQPARAVYMFLKVNKIEYVDCAVALRKREHLSEEYAKVNPFKKVPAIDHDGFKLSESVAILRYLVREYRGQVPNHWYPSGSKERARVDEFLSWQHLNLRANGSMYFRERVIKPVWTGKPVDEEAVTKFSEGLKVTLDQMEAVFFEDGRPFLCGSEISIADLLGSAEMEQPRSLGYDMYTDRPKLKEWMTNVRDNVQPHYDDAHKFIFKFAQQHKPL